MWVKAPQASEANLNILLHDKVQKLYTKILFLKLNCN